MRVEDLRIAVHRTFAHEGRPPVPNELAAEFETSTQQVDPALRELTAAHHRSQTRYGLVSSLAESHAKSYTTERDATPCRDR